MVQQGQDYESCSCLKILWHLHLNKIILATRIVKWVSKTWKKTIEIIVENSIKKYCITNNLDEVVDNICQKKRTLLTLSQNVFKKKWTPNVKIPTNWFNLYIQCHICITLIPIKSRSKCKRALWITKNKNCQWQENAVQLIYSIFSFSWIYGM